MPTHQAKLITNYELRITNYETEYDDVSVLTELKLAISGYDGTTACLRSSPSSN